jgi:hypothetical protein
MTFASPISKIARLVASGTHDEALALIEKVVDRTFCEPLNVGRAFGAPQLDRLCQAIGAASLERLGAAMQYHVVSDDSEAGPNDVVVYLVSKLQPSGGHTAVLADIIRLSPPSRNIVIVTGTCGRTDREAVRRRFESLQDVALEYSPPGSRLAKLEWIQRRLAGLDPHTVWLFNHHQDSVAIAAVQPGQGYRVRFYHHGDHHLCLGVHLGYAEHIDPHPMGYHNCRGNLGVRHNRYLPLVAPDLGERAPGPYPPEAGGLITCTAGGFNKLEIPYFVRYTDIVPAMLQATGGRHIHLGTLTPHALRQIRRGLGRYGIAQEAFVYVPYVPSVWRALHEFAVDLYVASFPYGGGRTLVEVIGAGVPVVLHSHCEHRMLGGIDMAYEGAFIWRDPEELLAYLRTVDRAALAREGQLARRWYETYHREEIMQRFLDNSQSDLDVPPLREDYRPDALMLALQTCREVSMRGILNRLLWRYYRRWQAMLGRWM